MTHVYVDAASLVSASAVAGNTPAYRLSMLRSPGARLIYLCACQTVEAFVLYEKVWSDRAGLEFAEPWLPLVAELSDLIERPRHDGPRFDVDSLSWLSKCLMAPELLLERLRNPIRLAEACISEGLTDAKGFVLPHEDYLVIIKEALPEPVEAYCGILGLDSSWSEAVLAALYNIGRARHYGDVAERQGLVYVPHKFRADCWREVSAPRFEVSSYVAESVRSAFERRIGRALGKLHDYDVEAAPLGDYILRTCSGMSSVAGSIRTFRQRAQESGFYNWFAGIEGQIRRKDWEGVGGSVEQMERAVQYWLKKKRVKPGRKRVTVSALRVVSTDVLLRDRPLRKGKAYSALVWMMDAALM